MPVPTPSGSQKELGRTGKRSWTARWTATNLSNFVAQPVLNLSDIGSEYSNPRYKVVHIEWAGSATVSGLLYFDSLGDNADVLTIPDGATAGEIDFAGFPDGCVSDPDSANPGNLILDTFDAADGDTITLTIEYRVGGKRF
jgi:hypothetical protein